MLEFTVIKTYNIRGYEATVDNKRVEVVKAYENDWRVFKYMDGSKTPLYQPSAIRDTTPLLYAQAMGMARRWLTTPKEQN